jgi:putative inorganic carbon (HCO3(-)) transporter
VAAWRENSWLILVSILFIALLGYTIWIDSWYGYLLPFGLLTLFVALFYTEYTFFFILAATPLSINIEEYTDSFGLFLPTEPLLFGTMLLLLMQSLKYKVFPLHMMHSPIIWTVGLYLLVIFLTAIVSSNPVVSFKFLLARLWFIVPVLGYGTNVFSNVNKIRLFLWLFLSAMTIAMIYTLVVHAGYRFGEKESHWVMWPFFKDHTIYGAIVALVLPLAVSFLFAKQHAPLQQFLLIGMIFVNLLALYFSYTRAAWLSVFLGMVIWMLIRLKVKFSLVASVVLTVGLVIWFSWDAIQQDLERNKFEHTTEEFSERLQSAANVTTDASNLERLNRWSCAIAMFEERPLTGFGPGTYAFEYARFQDPENLTIISTNFGDLGNAHSEYLGPLAEMGIFGLLAMLAIVAAIFYQAIVLYNRWPNEDREMKTLIMGMIISLSTYFIHAFLNNYLDTDKAAVPIWAMCAVVIAQTEQLRRKTTTK